MAVNSSMSGDVQSIAEQVSQICSSLVDEHVRSVTELQEDLARYKERVTQLLGQSCVTLADESLKPLKTPVEEDSIVFEVATQFLSLSTTEFRPSQGLERQTTEDRQPWASEPRSDITFTIEEASTETFSELSEMDRTMTFLQNNEDKGRQLIYLIGASANVLVGSIFFAWKNHMKLLMNGEIQDDTEVERAREAALAFWPMPSDLPDLQRYSIGETPSMDDPVLRTSTMSAGGNKRAGNPQAFQQSSPYCCRKLILRPDSKKRLFWDVLGFIMIVYDAMVMPVLAAFDLQRTSALNSIWYLTTTFWSADLVSNFFVAFYVEGVFEMRLRPIAMKYLQSWFVLDLLVVMLDWCFIILFIVDGHSRSNVLLPIRLLRQVRTIRLFRLVRLARVFPKIMAAADGIRSDSIRLMMSLVMSVAIIIFICHVVACAWYAIGVYNHMASETWVKSAGLNENSEAALFKTEFAYRYLISLHWAFCQFTPASMEVHPQNTPERGFAVCVIVLGMVSFSSFVSSITATMTQLRTINVDKYKRDATLRRYFDQAHLSTEIVKGITDWIRAFNERSAKNHRLHENEIPQLCLLPDRLRKQMHQEVYMVIWNVHPFCAAAKELDPNTTGKLCHRAIREERSLEGNELFRKDTVGTQMFFIRCGALLYSFGGCDVEVGHREWVCESSLWLPWIHTGTMHVQKSIELMVIDGEEFQKIIQAAWVAMRRFASAYAAFFVRHECEFTIAGNSWLTDLCWCRQKVHSSHCRAALLYNSMCTARGHPGGLKLWGAESVTASYFIKPKRRTRSRITSDTTSEAGDALNDGEMSEYDEWV